MADIPRVKSNIGKMIDQGAPEADIDAYLASEGVSTKDLHAVSTEGRAAGIAKSAGVGVAKGGIAIAGGAGDLRGLLSKGVDYLGDKIGVSPESVETAKGYVGKAARLTPLGGILANAPTSQDIQSKIEEHTGEFYKPKTTEEKYAQTVGEFLPAAAAGPGRMVPKLVSGVLSGLGSEAAGQYAGEGSAAEPYARVGGAIAGAMTPMAAARAVTPSPSSPARQRLVDLLRDEGVTSLTAGQRTGNKALQYGESILGDAPGAGQGAANIQRQGQEQFTRATLRRAGHGLDDAQPEVLAQNHDRLTQNFNNLSARNNLTPDNQFVTDVVAAARNYRRVPDSQQRQMVQGYIDDIVAHVNAGNMPGPQYQEMRSRLTKQAHSLRESDPTLSEALRDLRNALDNAMGRSIAPADQDLWNLTRQQYGAQKDIAKAASRAGEATAEGQITPANLRNVAATNNRDAYSRGQGQFSELARAGAGVMAPLPNSGTGQRMAVNSIATGLGSALGGAAGSIPGAIGGAAVGAAVPAALGRALMSAPVQGYLGNQALSGVLRDLPPARRAALIALLNEQGFPQIEGPRQ